MDEKITELLKVLEDPAFRKSELDEYTRKIESILGSVLGTDLEDICCNLFHYISDGDIRIKDNDYREMQVTELDKLIDLLKVGKLNQAKQISFLHESPDL